MAKYNSDNTSNTNNQSNQKVNSIEELLNAKRARNQQGLDKSNQSIERATDLARQNAGKATRARLQNDLINRTNLAVEEGIEEGIREFLNQDVHQIIQAVNGQIGSSYQNAIASNETKLLEAEVVDAAWEEEVDFSSFSLDFGTSPSLFLQGSSDTKVVVKEDDEELKEFDDILNS